VVKKLVTATGAENYNVLQNNGRIAHQEVDHVCLPFPFPSLFHYSVREHYTNELVFFCRFISTW
jgi:hypothetical protein